MYIVGYDAKGAMKKPITLRPEQTLLDARNAMIRYNISRVVLAKRKRPLGVVTEKDIARFLYEHVPSRQLDEISLEEVVSKGLVTVDPDTNLRNCARLMLKSEVSSLVVVDAKRNLMGILTKTDLTTAYIEYFSLTHKVKEFMTRRVVTVAPDEPIHSALMLMSRHQISRVVVASKGRPVGIITGRDLLALGAFFDKNRGQQTKKEYPSFVPSGIKGFLLASEVMTARLITAGSNSDLADAAYLMLRNSISGLPVTDSKGSLSGIVTKTDVVRALASSQI